MASEKRKHLILGKFRFVLLNSDDLESSWTEHASKAAQGENKALYVLLFCFKEKDKKYYILEMLISIFFSQSREGKYNYFF